MTDDTQAQIDRRRAEDKVYDLILAQIASVKDDVKEGFETMSNDIKGITTNCSNKTIGCNNKYIDKSLFWRIVTAAAILLMGSYGFTSYVLELVTKVK